MQSCFYFTNLLPTVPTYDKMICYYITKEEMNLPPSSRLEISSCNRTTSFHHTPLLYWVPSAKRNPLFYFTKQNSLEVLEDAKKATYAAKVY